MLKQLFKRLFPARTPHVWDELETEWAPVRTCAVCGQHDEWDYGGGHVGGGWMTQTSGDRAKHLIPEMQALDFD